MDLNSYALSPDGENAVDTSRARDAKPLTGPSNGKVQVRAQELVVDQIRDYHGASDVSGIVGFVKKRKMESLDEASDLGKEIRSVDERIGGFVVDSKSSIDGEKREEEGTCVRLNPKLVAGDESEPETAGSLAMSSTGFKHTHDALPCIDSFVSGHGREDGNGDGSGNLTMEIDAKVENSQNLPDVELAKRLEPYVSKDQTVSGDVNSPAASISEFRYSDLVWGKVRSYPWWPGQILDPSIASEKAKKYFKKGSYLIAYFGDQTFAWNKASRIKPFQQHFWQMEKLSSSADFRDSIDCALDEVSRRVYYGLACPCVSKEIYDKLKIQTIVNTGIREESCINECGDSFSDAASFGPLNLVEYVKSLACFPVNNVSGRLKFVTTRAQLLAFHRWKGYPELPEFQLLHGSLESAPKISLLGQVKDPYEDTDSVLELEASELASSKKIKSANQDSSHHKPKNSSRGEMEKTLSEFIAEWRLSKNSRNGSNDKSEGRLVFDKKHKIEDSSFVDSVGKVRKIEDTISDDSIVNHRKSTLSAWNVDKLQQAKPVFGVGASILKVASRLNSSNPIILKPYEGSSKKSSVKNKSKERHCPTKP